MTRSTLAAGAAGSCAALCLGLALFLPADPLMAMPRTGALVAGTIILLATGLLAESLTALVFFTIAMLGRIAPAEVVFSGLTSSAFWLIFSGLVIGVAIKETGLGDRLAARLAVLMGTDFRRTLIAVVGFGVGMAFIMPSAMGRIILILPILSALATHLGHKPNSQGHRGLMMAGVFGTFLPSFAILPANIPNNVLAGIVETSFQHRLAFGDYLFVHFPVLGLLKTLVVTAVLCFLFRKAGNNRPLASTATTPITAAERRLAVVLVVALALWSSDAWHHISPAWIGMTAAVLCLFPGLHILRAKAIQRINIEPVLYVGAIIGIGALVLTSGLGQYVAEAMLRALPLRPGASATDFLTLSGMSTALALATTQAGMPAVLTPLSPVFASAAGLPIDAVFITQVIGFSTVLFPYQAPPLVMAMEVGGLPRGEMTVICLSTAALTVAVLWPLDYLWLTAIGRL